MSVDIDKFQANLADLAGKGNPYAAMLWFKMKNAQSDDERRAIYEEARKEGEQIVAKVVELYASLMAMVGLKQE